MKSLSIRPKLVASAVLAVCALAGAVGSASAAPILQIVTTNASAQEVVGDSGGSAYPWAGGAGSGAGAPSTTTTPNPWPNGPGIGPDPSFPGSGVTGYDASYLYLSEAANVTFQFMGGGNASLVNLFGIDTNLNGALDPLEVLFNRASTNPCAIALGATTPSCVAGTNQFTFFFGAGALPFLYVTGQGVTLDNTGAGLGNPGDESEWAGYMLGADPYLATGLYDTSGTAVYAALSDRVRGPGEHDYSDMTVRISVPEPGTLALLGLAMGGLALIRRRTKKSM